MKKKLITIVIGAMLCAGLFAGCGQSDTKQDKAAGTESAKQADTKDEGETIIREGYVLYERAKGIWSDSIIEVL